MLRRALKQSQMLVGLVKAARSCKTDWKRANWYLARPKAIQKYLAGNSKPRLQIGSGLNMLAGWLNTDYSPRSREQVYLDATVTFPFSDHTFGYIFSEHVIEHLGFRGAMKMLTECHRVLKPGGKIRISTPNLLNIASLMKTPGDTIQEKYIRIVSDKYIPDNKSYLASHVVNNFFWDFGHFFVFDPITLRKALTDAGFTEITEWEPGKSNDPEISNIESHGKIVGDDINRFETMVMQAVRP
jgi:predicted SAM-dependent methyltransferase